MGTRMQRSQHQCREDKADDPPNEPASPRLAARLSPPPKPRIRALWKGQNLSTDAIILKAIQQRLFINQRFSISSYFSKSFLSSLQRRYWVSIGAMSRTYLMRRLLFLSNSFWQFSICSRNSRRSPLMRTMAASIRSWDISYPPRLVKASFNFLQQTYKGRKGSFSSWLGWRWKLKPKSLSQLLSQFLTFFFSLTRLSTLIASMYCSNSTRLALRVRVSSRPSRLKASFSLLGASFSIHSPTDLYLTTDQTLLEEVQREDPSLMTEKESFWLRFLLELFSCLMRPSSSRTLGLHSMAIFSVLVNRSTTVDVTSSLRMSNSIATQIIQYYPYRYVNIPQNLQIRPDHKYMSSIYLSFNLIYHVSTYNDIMNLSLDNSSLLQGEPSIKNAHTASHLTIVDNQLVFLCIDEAIQVYSLSRIAQSRAALIKVIPLSTIFNNFQKEHYEDFISSIFRNAEKQDFSAQLFSREQDIKKNALLQVENIKARLTYFNNSKLRPRKMEFSQKGQLLILLHDGRTAILFPATGKWCEGDEQTINLNEIVKEKILQACFIGQCVGILTSDRVVVYDTAGQTRIFNQKISYKHVNSIYGLKLQKDAIRLFLICNYQIVMIDMNNRKKKLTSSQFMMESFVNQSFFYRTHLFVCTHAAITRIDFTTGQLQATPVAVFSQPCELLHVDQSGKFHTKSLTNNRESVWLIESTTNGVFVGITVRRNGNYKEGRLIVFEPTMNYYLQRLIRNVQTQCQVNMADAVFVTHSRQNKDVLSDFANLHRGNQFVHSGITLTSEEYDTVSINVGHAFEGKEIAKQRILERKLRQKYENKGVAVNKLDYTDLVSRCCFSGAQLLDEDLNHCVPCDLFGKSALGNRCPVCQRKMMLYQQLI